MSNLYDYRTGQLIGPATPKQQAEGRASGQPAADADTMTVTVRDRAAEPPWGRGLARVATRQITISAFCPKDGQRRGTPIGENSHEDGIWYWVQRWNNPCGHLDMYEDVIAEARQRGTLAPARDH